MKQLSIKKARRIMPACALILATTLFPSTDGFRSSATATPPDVVPLDLPTKQMRTFPQTQPNEIKRERSGSRTPDHIQAKVAPRKITYDLGLGKNEPVTNKRAKEETNPTDESLHPARFMVEHESVIDFPSPLDSAPKSSLPIKSPRKNLPKVNHRRHSEDVLHIRDSSSVLYDQGNHNNDNNSLRPVIAPIHEFTKFDVNTVWVEMMLHNEHNKMLAAQSQC